MQDFLKKIFASEVLTEDTKSQIQKEFDTLIENERKAAAASERKALSEQYKADRKKIIASMDQMISEALEAEVAELKEELSQLRRLKVKMVKTISEADKKANAKALRGLHIMEAMLKKVAKTEMQELSEDRAAARRAVAKSLKENQIKYANDRKKLVENGGKVMEYLIKDQLSSFVRDMHEDINEARKNDFGRSIFEAFASEFSTTHFNENLEANKLKIENKKLQETLIKTAKTLKEERKSIKGKLVEETRKRKILENKQARETEVSRLLKPLKGTARHEMAALLEGVSTDKLKTTFTRYLPIITENHATKSLSTDRKPSGKPVLSEQKLSQASIRDGKKAEVTDPADKEDSTLIELRRRAGIPARK